MFEKIIFVGKYYKAKRGIFYIHTQETYVRIMIRGFGMEARTDGSYSMGTQVVYYNQSLIEITKEEFEEQVPKFEKLIRERVHKAS